MASSAAPEPAAPATAAPIAAFATDAAPARRVRALRGLLPFLRPYRTRIAFAMLLLTGASVVLLAVPLAFRDLIDSGLAQQAAGSVADRAAHGETLGAHFLGLFGLALAWAVMVGVRYYHVSWVGERVTADLREAVYARVLAQSPRFFETLPTGDVLSRLTGDTTLVQTVVGSSVSMGLRSLFQFVGGMTMLAATSLKLFAINVALLALLALPMLWFGRRVRRQSRESTDRVADASALAGEVLNAATTVQSFANEPLETRRFDARVETAFEAAVRRTRSRAGLVAFVIAAIFGAIVFVLWLGARAVAAGEMTPGELASFVLYAGIAAGSVGVIAEVWGELMRAAGATERLIELLQADDALPQPAAGGPVPAWPRGSGAVSVAFDAVRFRYPSRPQVDALAGLTLEIAAGETVAFVGPTGAGKTTVFQLLQRFYDVSEGALRIDGVDVRSLPLATLRRRVAVVPQEPVIFSCSALENIRYGRPEADDEAVRAAARAALADEFIARLPEGYDTFLGERGVRLSGGQRQRLAIARAILKDAPLLLLDEATSALDAESERLVQAGLEAAMRNRTTLVIAHRLATVQRVDRIVVLEHGRVVEVGTPGELREGGGLYARLARLQLDTQPG